MSENIIYEEDSSLEAWEKYQKIYKNNNGTLFENFDFEKLVFYNYYNKVGLSKGHYCRNQNEWHNYVDMPLKSGKNRKYILENNASYSKGEDGNTYFAPASRLGGECDFNFNNKKCFIFKSIIKDNKEALEKLEKCKANHHNIVNFSLMQALGNMQGYKGSNRFDRLDVFIRDLDAYFNGTSANILTASTNDNRTYLIGYLSLFDNIYDYCREVYLLTDKKFVDEIISQGKLPINDCADVIRYMNLAFEFWNKKREYIEKNVPDLKVVIKDV